MLAAAFELAGQGFDDLVVFGDPRWLNARRE
jgi:hypothetical protein